LTLKVEVNDILNLSMGFEIVVFEQKVKYLKLVRIISFGTTCEREV